MKEISEDNPRYKSFMLILSKYLSEKNFDYNNVYDQGILSGAFSKLWQKFPVIEDTNIDSEEPHIFLNMAIYINSGFENFTLSCAENRGSMIFREGFQIGYEEDGNELFEQLGNLNGI